MSLSQFPKVQTRFIQQFQVLLGSRESIAQEGRDKVQEAKLIIDETCDKVLNHIQHKLPEEVLKELDVIRWFEREAV